MDAGNNDTDRFLRFYKLNWALNKQKNRLRTLCFLTQMMLLRQCGQVFFQPRSVVFSVPPGHLDQFLHFLFQLCVDTLYTLSFHNENQSKRREYITCTEPGRVNVIKCLP